MHTDGLAPPWKPRSAGRCLGVLSRQRALCDLGPIACAGTWEQGMLAGTPSRESRLKQGGDCLRTEQVVEEKVSNG